MPPMIFQPGRISPGERRRQVVAEREPLLVVVLERDPALVRPVEIRQELAQRLGVLDEGRL